MSGARQRSGLTSIAVTSGKGGVGKTNVAINLAVSLARLRHRVAILDADFGLGNVDVLLGLAPTSHIGHVLAGEKRISEVLVEGPRGVQVIPASSGCTGRGHLTESGNPIRQTRSRGMRPAPGRRADSSGARERSSGRPRTVPAATVRRSCCTASTCCRRRTIGRRR